MLEEIEKAVELSSSIANMFSCDVFDKLIDNQILCVEGAAYSRYATK